ncbi:MAG TPA: four-helix bundle copper-binding protein [Thermoleophilaceae bacterium]
MLDTYPGELSLDRDLLVRCIEACSDCAESCTQCADDCLAEEGVQELTTCIRLNLDCADVCAATGRVVSRQTGYDPAVTSAVLRACIEACGRCAGECEVHAAHGMEHCGVCAEECRRCEQACQELLAAI